MDSTENIINDRFFREFDNKVTIIQYILENPYTTKNKVIKYMEEKGLSTHMTTLKLIDKMISQEILGSARNRTSGFHHLYIDGDNGFNKITLQLSEIETIIKERFERIRQILNSLKK